MPCLQGDTGLYSFLIVGELSLAISRDLVFIRPVLPGWGGGGGYFRNFWVGMCRWDPGTLNLYQS